ncbi:MAG TPA: cell division protein FtsZ [Solirubrobacterales bacterium]|nr:cell division protein FtsZ [Solirubrobacterales bacterium]
MREGPLSDLFRSTAEDAPADPPEAPRYGRQDPAEAKKAEAAAEQQESLPVEEPVAAEPTPPAREQAPEPEPDPEPEYEPAPFVNQGPAAETPPERLKRVFSEEPKPRHERYERPEEPSVSNPRYGREEPAYEPPGSGEPHQPVIKVVGVGGAGVNAVNRMVDARIPGVEFMAVNTDLQSLQLCVADVTVHIGDEQTRGLGAGADPEVGHRSAFEEQDKIKRLLKGSDMVFVAAGAGGGTGSGAAPVVARLAREVGALTVGIVTKPFTFEGNRRGSQANKGIEELAAEVDTLIVVPNDRLLEVLDQQTSMVEAFQVADDVLRQGVQGISDLVTLPAVINLDFADVRTIMSDAGRALLGIGMAHGNERAILAAEKAISSPLLETSMEGARSILLSITGGSDLSLVEVSEAAKVVGEAAHPDANIIFGANVDDELSDQIWVTVVATRFDGRPSTPRRAAEPTIRRTKDSGRGRPPERSGELGIDVPEFLPG